MIKFLVSMLIVGLVLNVLVSLALAASIDLILRPVSAMRPYDGVHWIVSVTPLVGTDSVEWTEFSQSSGRSGEPEKLLPTWVARPFPSASEFADRMQRSVRFQATGFPWRSSWCEVGEWSVRQGGSGREQTGVRGGAELPLPPWRDLWGQTIPRVLPLRPIWPGLALNVSFYAVITAALVWFVYSLRRVRRFNHGECPCCRSAMRGDYTNACPKCSWERRSKRDSASAKPPIRLSRALAFVIAMLACGIVVNAIASLALAASVSTAVRPVNGVSVQDGVHWTVQENPYFGSDCIEWTERSQRAQAYGSPPSLLPSWLSSRPPPSASDLTDRTERQAFFQATGLPWRSSWCEVSEASLMNDQSREQTGARGGAELPLPPWRNNWSQLQARVLPLRPIWSGLALNVLFYAIVAAGFGWIIGTVARLRRFNRAACPRCGYAMRGDYTRPCPECGWTTAAHGPGNSHLE